MKVEAMRKHARKIATALSATALAAALSAAALSAGAPSAGALSTGALSTAGAGVTRATGAGSGPRMIPGVLHVGNRTWEDAPTSADCEQGEQLPCYDPAQIQQAYGLSGFYAQNTTGAGVSIAIVDSYGSPTVWNDLTTFDSQYGLPNPKLTIIHPAGRVPRYNAKNADMVAWAGETTLDVEWAHAIAPGANIVLVETPNDTSDSDFARAEDYVITHHLASVISQSWSGTEHGDSLKDPGVQALHAAYVEAERHHVTVLDAAGDNGATNPSANIGSPLLTFPNASYPATDPLVTAVGGTELYLDDNGDHTSPDTVWNDTWNTAVNQAAGVSTPSATAGGGGKSTWFARPSYQNSVRQTVGARRGVPDVSMNAATSSPVLVYQSFGGEQAGWYPVAGTSEATPLMAGIVALADQVAGHSLGFINPALYQLAADHAQGIVLVTSGSNTVTFKQSGHRYTVRGFTARKGYSRAAGVGTIDGQYFIPELARLG
jgi:subtilase family serine protease